MTDTYNGRKNRDWKWWQCVVVGVAAGAFSVYLYFDLTELEVTGGRLTSPGLSVVYDWFGKWGVVGMFGATSLFVTGVGIWCWFDGSVDRTSARDNKLCRTTNVRRDPNSTTSATRGNGYLIFMKLLGPLIAICIVWVFFVAHLLDLGPGSHLAFSSRDSATALYLGISLVVTITAVAYGGVKVFRAIRLARVGVDLLGQVRFTGPAVGGLVEVHCEYAHGGRRFVKKIAVPENLYYVGDQMELVVDPKHPDRCERREDLFPKSRGASSD